MRRVLVATMAFCASAVYAQPPNSTYPSPRLNSVFPCGGMAGTIFEVTVRGSDLDDATALRFSHKGIGAELITEKAPPKKDAKVTAGTAAKFKVTIGKDVPQGAHEVRVVGRWGVSNPRAFIVGTRTEASEAEPNSDVPQAQDVAVGSVVNGVIDAQTDVDYFRFSGKAGQRILIHCAASSIDSRARPLVECFSSDGCNRIGMNNNHEGNDALCDVKLPVDGVYYVRVSEFAYTAGGSDYFYRLTVGMETWLEPVFPPAVQPRSAFTVRPLEGTAKGAAPITANAPEFAYGFSGTGILPQAMGLEDGFFVTARQANTRPVFFANAPVIEEAEQGKPDKPQHVISNCEVAGRIDGRNDRDTYSFTAKKNEPLMIELLAGRIGTSMDGVLTIHGPDGREIAGEATLDDDPSSIHPTSFFTQTTDPPPYRLVPPSDGVYSVTVWARDANANYGPRTIYRLRIAPPKPDFRAVVMARNRDNPSGVTVMPSGETALDVFAQRRDGFTGPVNLAISGLPEGITAKPAIIGTGQTWGMIVLSGAASLKSTEAAVTVTASAKIGGKEVKRLARSASITWNVPNANNSPTIARLDSGLVIATRPGEKSPYRLSARFDKAVIKGLDNKERPAGGEFVVKPGERIVLPVSVIWQGAGTRPNVVNLSTEPTLSYRGASVLSANNNQQIPVPNDRTEQTLTIDVRNNTAPGRYAVMIRGDTRAPMVSDPKTKTKKDFTVLAFAEPVTVKVLPVSLGRLTAQTLPVKLGGSSTLTVKVERAFDYDGEFLVKVNFPTNSGLAAEPGTILAGTNEVKIMVNASRTAKPGNVQNVPVEAQAVFDGDEVTHKTQANFTITK